MLHENENLYALNTRRRTHMYERLAMSAAFRERFSLFPYIMRMYICVRAAHSPIGERDVISMHGRRPFIFPHVLADNFDASARRA
jgi:hypothetical protein